MWVQESCQIGCGADIDVLVNVAGFEGCRACDEVVEGEMTHMEELSEWGVANEAIARAVCGYRGDREGLIDHLAYALEESCIQFPIMEMGEDLDDICPFTFFASFSRPMTDERRARLVSLVCDALDVETAVPSSFAAYPTVEDYQARFFSHNKRNAHREIEALWDLFQIALDYAQAIGEVHGGQGDGEHLAEAESSFVAAYDRVGSVRTAGFKLLPVALVWVSPSVFSPLAFLAVSDDKPAVHGADCVRVLHNAHGFGKSRGDGEPDATGVPSRIGPVSGCGGGACGTSVCAPSLDLDMTDRLLEAYAGQFADERLTSCHPNVWRAVCCFQRNWNEDADDFATMLERALACHDGLLNTGYFYNPYKEATVFARKEPELTRRAFAGLFGWERPVEERIVIFERMMSSMFERHRGEIASAMPRRSSHGNYLAGCTYLFLRHPDTCYLFSPSKLRVFDKMTGYGCAYRLAKPECVTQYFTLCDAIFNRLDERGDLRVSLLARVDETLTDCGWQSTEDGVLDRGVSTIEKDIVAMPGIDVPAAKRHVLVDDIARFACELEKAERSRGVPNRS